MVPLKPPRRIPSNRTRPMTQPEIEQNDVAPSARGWRWLKKLLVFCGLTFFATVIFMVALIVTMPASIAREFVTLPPQITAVYGRLGTGRVQMVGGYSLSWDVDARALLRLRLRYDVSLEGPDTLLVGAASVSPWAIEVSELTGRAGAGLLVLTPDVLVESCSSRAVVDVQMLRLSRDAAAADGRVSIDAGSCIDAAGRQQTVPQMTVDMLTQGGDAVAILTDLGGQLARITLAGDRRLIIRVEPEGATLVPGLPTSGPLILEYPL